MEYYLQKVTIDYFPSLPSFFQLAGFKKSLISNALLLKNTF